VRTRLFRRLDYILIAIAFLSAFLNIYNIWKQKYVNAYYTSAVTSMLQSFHNFFYASFDPGGFVTVDKPPVAFWVQTVSAYLFGVKGWSVILPQALAGVGSVLLMYFTVKPSFGRTAARLSSLVFACTPIAAAVARTNNVDSLLVFTLLLGTWMLFRGIRKDRWGWVVAAFGTVGLAFNMKMLQAYMVVPAFYLFYLLAVKTNWKKKLGVLAAASVLLVAVSMSWAVTVDSISKDSRPYIGSSQTNSVLELAFGYNGISRLTGNGMGGGRGGFRDGERPDSNQMQMRNGDGSMPGMMQGGPNGAMTNGPAGSGQDGGMPPGGMPDGGQGPNLAGNRGGPMGNGRFGGPMGGGGAFGTGQPGPFRLFQSGLSGQISWLIPFAGLASVGLLSSVRRRKPLTVKQTDTLFWLAWLLPAMAFFSVAGFFHQYYLIMLAPPIAALTGAGWVELWQLYRNKEGWKTWLLPIGILATTALQLYIMSPYTGQIGLGWSIGIGTAGAVLSAALCFRQLKEKLARIAAAAGLLVLLAVPLYWAATPLLYGGNSMLPEAGPQLKSSAQGPGDGSGRRGMGQEEFDSKLLKYVTEHNTGEKYLFATSRATTAAPYIIESGKPVMAMGGFSGSDPILTLDKLKEMVKNKEVKFFLLDGGGFGGFGGGGGSSELTEWIKQNGTEIPSEQWQSSSSDSAQGSPMRMGRSMTLYEIKS
jgi:4-amino-4-deoxy-L-arabinose transferase-like glycosyltransferase